jgi:cytochrome c biogenesis protein
MRKDSLIQRFRFIKSMGFGIFLLVSILILSVIGTLLPQGYEPEFYRSTYSEYIAELVTFLGVDHIYTSMLFAVLFMALAINLLLCSTSRFKRIIIKVRQRYDFNSMKEISSYKLVKQQKYSTVYKHIFKAFGAAGFFKYKNKNGIYYSSKNVVGYFGSWLLHLGIMLVILFYIYGQATFYSSGIYGTPGEVISLEGTNYKAAIRTFNVSYRENGSISQYTTALELIDAEGKRLKQGNLNVNNPMRYKGYSFYQTGTGWAADCNAYKDTLLLKKGIIYETSAINIPEENIAIALTKFYPDFAANDLGFTTLSDKPNNPALLYAVYYRSELVKMDIVHPGDAIKWNEYSFNIDNFRRYTYLKINKMRGQEGAAIGGILIILGLLFTFYFKPRELAIKKRGDMLYIYSKAELGSSDDNSENAINIKKYLSNKEEFINVR